MKGGGGDPGDRLVNASSNGNFQTVREILEANPDKVNQVKSFTPFELLIAKSIHFPRMND